MSKRIKILLVANSVPLPATDFLKYKFFGLSKMFDTHFICWDSVESRTKFYNKYGEKLSSRNIHLFYDQLNLATSIKLFLLLLLRVLFTPHIAVPILSKLLNGYAPKQAFIKFNLYYPIVRLKPDILHFEYGVLAKRFSDIKKFVNCKTSVSFRGYDINYVGIDDEQYYQDVWQNFDGFHFLGNDLKMRAVKRGYNNSKLEALIPPAIDANFFKASVQKEKQNKFVIISVGRLVWKKGFEYGLQAVKQLKEQGVECEYRICADGPHSQAILFMISELGLEDEVKLFTDKTTGGIKEEMELADVFLHPAISEGFSNAVLEAQAMGLPVITTDADGLSENIEDRVTGFVVPVFDVAAMTKQLMWVYKNREAAKAMGQKGVERVCAHFTIEKQMTKFEEFYTKLHEQ